MNQQGFDDYTHFIYGRKNGTSNSYIMAIRILDRLFSINDIFGLNGNSLTEIDDERLLQRIADFVVNEEKKYKLNNDGIFSFGLSTQMSYPRKGFCSAAMRHLQRYQAYSPKEIEANKIADRLDDGKMVSERLLTHFDITGEGRDQDYKAKARIGQDYYRKMILSLYGGKCCIAGIDVPMLLRASHIVSWAEDKNNRLNPENGLCLSGTYDLAFDQHLISFDEEYRMIVGKEIRDHFMNKIVSSYFRKFEGKRLTMPLKYAPSQEFLQIHRSLLR